MPDTQQTPEQSLPESPAAAPANEAAEAATAAVDIMPSLEELLRAAELKAAEHHDAWLRAKAETENLRRRAQDDISKAHKFAAEKFAEAMLPVKDSLEAALNTGEQTVEALKAGVELTLRQLVSAFEKSNVTEVNPMGDEASGGQLYEVSKAEGRRSQRSEGTQCPRCRHPEQDREESTPGS